MNIGLSVSDAGGAVLSTIFGVVKDEATGIIDYTNLDLVMWIAILSSLLPLPLIRFLPDTEASKEDLPPGAEAGGRLQPVHQAIPVEKGEVT